MKQITCLFLFAVILTACTSVKQIGKVNMISTRNVDPNLNYDVISTYSGGSRRVLKKSKSNSIQEALDKTVKKVPGGEFLMNCKIYLVKSKYIAVEGDVWGILTQLTFRGFKIGDKVTWKKKDIINGKRILTGTITALKDDETCYVKVDNENDKAVELSYDDLTKSDK